MALDFSLFVAPKRTIVPVLSGSFILNKKRYSTNSVDGWSVVEITNNSAKFIEPANAPDIFQMLRESQSGSVVLGYTHHNSIIFHNFDVAKRRFNLQVQAPLRFNMATTFESIRAVVWEDGQVYYIEPNYSDIKTYDVKDLYEREESLKDQKGITPELRTLYLFHALERDQMRQVALESKRAADHERMMADIPYRLKVTLERVEAELIGYSLSGDRIIIDWRLKNGQQRYNSVVDKNFRILEAGICCSGDDRSHNLTSIVKLTESYQERNLVFKTRNTEGDRDDDWD